MKRYKLSNVLFSIIVAIAALIPASVVGLILIGGVWLLPTQSFGVAELWILRGISVPLTLLAWWCCYVIMGTELNCKSR